MLKLNSTGGKLDITLSDDAIYGTSRKPPAKAPRARAPSRAANSQGKHQNKPTTSHFPGKVPKEGRHTKPIKKIPVNKQHKPPSHQGKRTAKIQEEPKVTSQGSTSQGTSVITRAKLDSILSMLNTSQTGAAGSSLTPEQLTVLMTSIGKIQSTEQPQVPQEPPLQINAADVKSKNTSDAPLTYKTENNAKNNSQVENNKTGYRKELDEQVSSKRRSKELQKQKEAFEEYNPWGRPGAGAPIKSQSGEVLADYHSRTVKESVETYKQDYAVTTTNYGPAIPSQVRPAPVVTVASSTSNIDTTLPVALRSSFAVGAFEEYNPWGRPGAGAPIKNQSGEVLADYHNRAIKESVETYKQDYAVTTTNYSPAIPSQVRPAPVVTVARSTSNVDTTLPVALRSSFAVGAPGLVSNETQQKRLQELTWKQELEKQIEEKKEREKQRKLKEEQEDLLNLSWNNKHSKQPKKDTTPSHVSSNMPIKAEQPKVTAPQATQDASSPFLNQSLNESFNRSSHARGFGMHTMDPQSQTEAEKKRLKMLEHQRAVQEQVEENRRRKQQEREERLKEEAIEEARLAKERDNLNHTFAIEQKRKREKEEEAKRVSEALQQSVIDAYEASQLAKREKRQKHLEAGGHTARGGRTSSRSYVISRTSSHHGGQESTVSQSHSRQSTLSNYTTPRVTGRNTPRNKHQVSKPSQPDPPVPPLNLTRGVSPPIPALRNKIQQQMSHRSSTPTSVKGSAYLQRTVSTNSEPAVGTMSTHNDTHRSQLEDILKSDLSSSRYPPNEVPFDTIEDAFMIPYHRTDSATLPAPTESMEDATTLCEKTVKTKGNNLRKKTTGKSLGSTITPMYRTQSTHLKPGKADAEVSPRRTKGVKQTGQPGLSSRSVTNKTTRGINSVTHSKTKHTAVESKTKKISPRIEAALSRLSGRQEIPESLATARQEMILQQLAALRQGLILKERELKQELSG